MMLARWVWLLSVLSLAACDATISGTGQEGEDLGGEPNNMSSPDQGMMMTTPANQNTAPPNNNMNPPQLDCPAMTPGPGNLTANLPEELVAERSLAVGLQGAQAFTNVHLEAFNAAGEQVAANYINSSGSETSGFDWSYSFTGLGEGSWCLQFRSDDHQPPLLLSQRMEVGPAPPPGTGQTAFKLVQHHQDSCEDNGFGVAVRVKVIDEEGRPLGGVPVKIDWDSMPVIDFDRWWTSDHLPPRQLMTDGDGNASFENKWPIWHDEQEEAHFHLFEISIDGQPSDTATEVTTGYWQNVDRADGSKCDFCPPGSNQNVWGHWSYKLTFQRTAEVTEVCRKNHDHAGQNACGEDKIYVDEREDRCAAL